MKKIPTVFLRDMSAQPAVVTKTWRPECEWVRDGEGAPTVKNDGTCCLVRGGALFKRREMRSEQMPPPGFELVDLDEETGKSVGWVPVTDSPDDKWHREAFQGEPDGTYELMGPKVQGNKGGFPKHMLVRHGTEHVQANPRTFEEVRDFLQGRHMEGIVWHHPDGRMAKVKRRDFGFKW